MEQHLVEFSMKARYYKLGCIDASTKQIWWVLHGYGQLAQFFIQKFKGLVESGICIIAPEGLSKFYLAGNSGRVGTSWMTRENRLIEIDNYVAYLNSIWEIEKPVSPISTTLFGFSQGAATAVRWAMNGQLKFDRLVLWAGLFPLDMDFEKGTELLKGKKVIEVLGKQDEFINKERIDEMMLLNQKLKINPHIIEFEGKHEINEMVLKEISSLYD